MGRAHFEHRLAIVRDEVLALGQQVAQALDRAVECLQRDDGRLANAIVTGDRAIDERQAAIQHLTLTVLTTQQPVARDLRGTIAAMLIASELERIGDYAAGIAALVLRDPGEPALAAPPGLYAMARAARTMLQRSMAAYAQDDAAQARRIWQQDTTVDRYQQALARTLLLAMVENPSTLTRATHQLWMVHNLERVADRATNICEQVIFMVEGEWPALQEVSADAILHGLPDTGTA